MANQITAPCCHSPFCQSSFIELSNPYRLPCWQIPFTMIKSYCYGTCNWDTRYAEWLFSGVSFSPFPKSASNLGKHKRWIRLVALWNNDYFQKAEESFLAICCFSCFRRWRFMQHGRKQGHRPNREKRKTQGQSWVVCTFLLISICCFLIWHPPVFPTDFIAKLIECFSSEIFGIILHLSEIENRRTGEL